MKQITNLQAEYNGKRANKVRKVSIDITQLEKKKRYRGLELSTTRVSMREIGLRRNHIFKARMRNQFLTGLDLKSSLIFVCMPGAGTSRGPAGARGAGMLVRL